ncbi:hypothetical protein JOE69_000805 [Arthrobacter russicus]|uniref:DUF2304 domain-containing protein n=1 Tax=Arthrobacter russicus TaxID=172040 RepID=A0ABU1J819_9MICC|nr:hypothetical protein [Arthrobacter russicus]
MISIGMVLVVLLLLRRGKLREKYAILWLVVGILTIILGFFPSLLDWVASLVGVQIPANLLFALSIVLLVGVGLHVSRELTILEDETRALAEEVAILRAAVEDWTASTPDQLPREASADPLKHQQPGESNDR